jgi:hypothetical protein
MFRWYQNAVVCYTYLSDVEWCSDQTKLQSRLSSSRWFTRGWTLQELIAPSYVVFYSAEWRHIGTKSYLCQQISSITGIDENILNGGDLEDVCIAKKMSWASNRKTSRTEDIAYCLLGIFDINMPPIYGEGKKAFLRLQQQIMSSTMDPSLFAWGTIVDTLQENYNLDQILGLKAIDWLPPEKRTPMLGLLADSPIWFKSCGVYSHFDISGYYLYQQQEQVPLPRWVDNGVMVSLFFHRTADSAHHWDLPQITQLRPMRIAILFCHSGPDAQYIIGLPLFRWGEDHWARTAELIRIGINTLNDGKPFEDSLTRMHIKPSRYIELEHGGIIFRRFYTEFECTPYFSQHVRYRAGYRTFQVKGRVEGGISAMNIKNGNNSFAFLLMRRPAEGKPLGALCVGVTPICQDGSPSSVSDIDPTSARVTIRDAIRRLPKYHHTMAPPFDSWVCEEEGFPPVYVRARRMPLGNGTEALVDVVDLIIPKHERTMKGMAKGWNDGLWLE